MSPEQQAKQLRDLYARCARIAERLGDEVPNELHMAIASGSLVIARRMLDAYLVSSGLEPSAEAWKALEAKAEAADARRVRLTLAMSMAAGRKTAIIRHCGDDWCLYSHDGKLLGRHATREKALAQEQAIEIHKHAG